MKPYILEIGEVAEVSGTLGQYLVELVLISDSGDKTFYKNIVVDAINEEFARKIADIRIEEMMLNNTSEIDSIYNRHNLINITKNYRKMYADIVVEMEKLRKKQENLLTAIVKDAQTSAEEGLDITDMGIEVELDGYEGHLVYAVRVVSEDREDGNAEWLELKIMSVTPNEYEWLSIYDFYSWDAEEILSEIMENL